MSRKTENIYKSIDALNELEKRLADFSKKTGERELDDIDFEMQQQLKNLKFWIESLYSYNGKSTSRAKKAASRENGKKGGRPPKHITVMRRRRIEIEETLIPDLERRKSMADNFEAVDEIEVQLQTLRQELQEINEELDNK